MVARFISAPWTLLCVRSAPFRGTPPSLRARVLRRFSTDEPGAPDCKCDRERQRTRNTAPRSAAMAHCKWNYFKQAEWSRLPGCVAGGDNQSPVHIRTADVVKSEKLKPFKLTGWETAIDGTICNTGHSVQFTPAARQPPATIQLHQGVSYTAQQFHFHWGEHHGEGSEHLVDGKQYDIELHFVHKKTAESGAADAPDAFTVLAVFGTEDNTTDGASGIWKQLSVPQHYGETIDIEGIKLAELLPSNLDYFCYEGSLTTPPCTEAVQWLVAKEPITVPRAFLEQLRGIEDEEKEHLCRNYRDVQPINKRKIETPALNFHHREC